MPRKCNRSRENKKQKSKKSAKRSKKGGWGNIDQRLWKVNDPDHPFNN